MLKKYLYAGGLAILFIFTLLLFNVLGIFTDGGFVTGQLEKHNASERISNASQIDQNVRNYLTDTTEELNETKLTQREADHLKDVKNLYTIGNILVALFFFLIALGFFHKLMPRLWEFGVLLFGIVMLLLALGAFVQSHFDSLFTLFHHILFTNDLWMLSPEHTLINIYPQEFFLNSFMTALQRTFFISLVLSVIFVATVFFKIKDRAGEKEVVKEKKKKKKKSS